MIELDKLVSLLTAAEGPEQGLALVETVRDDVPWEDLLVRVTVRGHGFDRHPIRPEDQEPFRVAHKLTLGLFEPIQDGVYRRNRITERTNLVLRLLALAPETLEVRQAEVAWIDGNDGVLDGRALASAFPRLASLMLVRTELDDWNELSRLPLEELRMYRCRKFDGTAVYRPVRLWLGESSVHDGRAFDAVRDLYLRSGLHPDALRSGFRSVRMIRCLGWSSCTNALLEAMAELPELEVVDVDQTVKSTRRGTGEYVKADLSGFARSPKLRILRLRQTLIDPHRLHPLIGHPTLESIELDAKWKRRIPKQVRRDLPLK